MPPSRRSDEDKAATKSARANERNDEQKAAERPAMAPEAALGIEPGPADGAYTDAAAGLAAAARETADNIGKQLRDLQEKYDGVQQTAPSISEATVSAGVQRIPMAIGEVERALEGLRMAGAELASRAVR
ncbi:hypothetical protein [Microbispora sp. CA-102843]|uniref:hypothetical protein n=1 Tax=Microbispora sp. CA-102843 TaxID=3239952 RepID=UPI003D8CA432